MNKNRQSKYLFVLGFAEIIGAAYFQSKEILIMASIFMTGYFICRAIEEQPEAK